jgi:hypothetical protein
MGNSRLLALVGIVLGVVALGVYGAVIVLAPGGTPSPASEVDPVGGGATVLPTPSWSVTGIPSFPPRRL